MTSLDRLLEFHFVFWFVIAASLVAFRKGNIYLILGLIFWGIESLISRLIFRSLEYESFGPDAKWLFVTQLIYLGGLVLLVFGVVRLMNSSPVSRTVSTSSGTGQAVQLELSSLMIPRNDTNTYSRALKGRDVAIGRLEQLAKREGLNVIVQKSDTRSSEVWGRIDYLMQSEQSAQNLTLRAWMEIHVERHDFHLFELLYTVKAQVGNRKASHTGLLQIDDVEATQMHFFITKPKYKLKLQNKTRQEFWQIWRPHNRIARIRPGWLSLLCMLGALLTFVIPYIGMIVGPLSLLAVSFFLALRKRGRQLYVLTSGQPLFDPRSLWWLDSWQVTVRRLGMYDQAVTSGILNRLQQGGPTDLKIDLERIGYWSIDGRVERDQRTVRYHRALGFIQITPYGENLYVSWECHLNSAAWAEQKVAGGIDRETGKDVVANRIIYGYQRLNEYDLADANFLSEWMHEAIKAELLLRMAEQKIDQEIDFTILRESRKNTLDQQSQETAGKSKKRSLFQRTA